MDKYGRLDGAANWAGVIRVNPIVEMTDENWNFVMDVNSTGVFNCIRAQLRVMKDGASIVSELSKMPIPMYVLVANLVERYQRPALKGKLGGQHLQPIAPASMLSLD